MKNKIIEFLTNKKILILGFGREGKSAYNFIKENNIKYKSLGIADKNEIDIDNVEKHCGDNYLDSTKDYDLVIKSPGIIIKDYISDKEKEKITSLTDMFLRFCPNKIVGITGTKGKSTTSSLIYHILKNNGYDTYLIGNIGVPSFNVIDKLKDETILVYELSCHQLEYVKKSPHIAILLNVYEEHLDHYTGIDAYVRCKKNIYKYLNENDYLIYGDIFKYIKQEEIDNLVAHKLYIDDNPLNIDTSKIETSLLGEHNKKNIITAIMATNILGVKVEDALSAVKTFKGLEHRLEYVGRFKNIKFYNDSIATAQEAVINAVKSINDVDTIIIGGMDRGLDYTPLAEFLSTSSVQNIILLPATQERIKCLLEKYTQTKHIFCVKDMEEAVKMSYKVTKDNKTCLLSPAAASYGFYLNFEKRGEHFKKLVQEYGK